MPKHNIRSASANDAFQILALIEAHAHYEEYSLIIEQQIKALENVDELPIYLYVVESIVSGDLIGYMSLIKQFSTWDMAWYLYLDCLYLTEHARGKGLGKRMMNFAQEKAREMDILLMQWQTPSNNTKAINFYHAQGAESREKVRFFLPIPSQENPL